MRRWSMPRWWHYMSIGVGGLGLVLTIAVAVFLGSPNSTGFVVYALMAAGFSVLLSADLGFGVGVGTQRVEDVRLSGVGQMLLGGALIAIAASTFTHRGGFTEWTTAAPDVFTGVLGALMILYGLGFVLRPDQFGPASTRNSAVR